LSRKPDPHSDERWLAEKRWYDSFAPRESLDYSDAMQYAEKRYTAIVDADRQIDRKAEWLFGIAFAATGAAMAAILSKHVSLLLSIPTLTFLGLAMFLAIRARLPSEREAPADIKGALVIYEDERSPKAIVAANIHLADKAVVLVSEWKSSTLLAATKSMFISAVLFLVPLALSSWRSTADPEGNNPQKSLSFQGGHVRLDLDLVPAPRRAGPEPAADQNLAPGRPGN
jgi:hypothetical protein